MPNVTVGSKRDPIAVASMESMSGKAALSLTRSSSCRSRKGVTAHRNFRAWGRHVSRPHADVTAPTPSVDGTLMLHTVIVRHSPDEESFAVDFDVPDVVIPIGHRMQRFGFASVLVPDDEERFATNSLCHDGPSEDV
jgi:hypothetical protein